MKKIYWPPIIIRTYCILAFIGINFGLYASTGIVGVNFAFNFIFLFSCIPMIPFIFVHAVGASFFKRISGYWPDSGLDLFLGNYASVVSVFILFSFVGLLFGY